MNREERRGRERKAPRVGLEPTPENTGKTPEQQPDSAPDGAFPADLKRVIGAWPHLSEQTRLAVLTVIDSAADQDTCHRPRGEDIGR
jgi:hypothetical protein